MGRAPCCDKTKVKRGPWSPEEDNTLKNYVDKHGTAGSWISLPQKAGLKRCGKSCRLRWLNYLRPNIKHGGFTQEEDNIILTLYHNIGSRWSIIASQLPGRTDNDVKNYWNTKLKKKLLPQLGPTCPSTTTTTANSFNLGPSSAASTIYSRNSKVYVDLCPDNYMLPYFPMEEMLTAQIQLPGLMEIPENMENKNCVLLPTLSPSFSLDNNASGSASWSGEEDAFLSELGMPYDLLNDFDFQDKFTDQTNHLNNFAYSLAN